MSQGIVWGAIFKFNHHLIVCWLYTSVSDHCVLLLCFYRALLIVSDWVGEGLCVTLIWLVDVDLIKSLINIWFSSWTCLCLFCARNPNDSLSACVCDRLWTLGLLKDFWRTLDFRLYGLQNLLVYKSQPQGLQDLLYFSVFFSQKLHKNVFLKCWWSSICSAKLTLSSCDTSYQIDLDF